MRHRIAVGTSLAVLLLAGGVIAGEGLKSGPQPGTSLAPFSPLNLNGDSAGEKVCQIWRNGNHPVAAIFAREISGPLTSLVKKIDEATAKNKEARMGSFVVFLSDEEGLEAKLKDLIKKDKLDHIVVTIDNPAGPPSYKLAKAADVTVLLYKHKKVESNYAFKQGELSEQNIDRIISDLSKILPEKETK